MTTPLTPYQQPGEPHQPGHAQGSSQPGPPPPQAPAYHPGYGQQGGPQMPPPPPGYAQQAPWGAPGSGVGPVESPKNFFAALFDWRFQTLITPRVVSWVYLAVMVLLGLYWLFMLVGAFLADPLFGVGVLIIGPILLVVSLAFFRMTLEFYFAVVRMSEDIRRNSGSVPPRV